MSLSTDKQRSVLCAIICNIVIAYMRGERQTSVSAGDQVRESERISSALCTNQVLEKYFKFINNVSLGFTA